MTLIEKRDHDDESWKVSLKLIKRINFLETFSKIFEYKEVKNVVKSAGCNGKGGVGPVLSELGKNIFGNIE